MRPGRLAGSTPQGDLRRRSVVSGCWHRSTSTSNQQVVVSCCGLRPAIERQTVVPVHNAHVDAGELVISCLRTLTATRPRMTAGDELFQVEEDCLANHQLGLGRATLLANFNRALAVPLQLGVQTVQ